MEFDWDEHNLFHIAMHGVTQEDAEAALRNTPVFLRDEIRNGEERRSRLGQDLSRRILLVVTTERGNKTRVVTAFHVGQALRQYYYARRVDQNDE